MKSRSKSISVFLTLLLVCSTVAMSSVQSDNTNGRVTGNEEISVSINVEYLERGGDLTLTVNAINLDVDSEYLIEWNLCDWYYWGCGGLQTTDPEHQVLLISAQAI